ncbi:MULTISPECIES: bifunctional 2-polyprenyl-6-hydroxyphenol methylase/3-demethylubiquinol 3-O-methyltransferase UbiG [unclassified Neisseria]|uniref:bifunctional 2-polyprenyl-6-hydroxyphenol methylase/3-demethylubiquinol 3-O-methyltransferase UbiG n=1 Tax=unclassified Neisseria TaxID=2623750 RepID=UPI002665ECC7|nr:MULTISPECIES: bifunctional 2-polyprenyl-6-hydroxyphenol methylase/3-demethylubiquinol 3-O-methyltransferase UbiG [unclassified Neisseria]MDO1510018.1 bifunctional 2-polyprenyl-6-hydroxyphenol methylase/3-demethylubiquinol 3-O-methyltransferase UbiG [Neisseria sp. MVDL19-042950]MDO1516218.1 bifunctional 2-polyprenyl-6-hydroxyphenol methylase/3-demethylubiquinol 3-O-methyltransferase UbiG [Neisseria sp. MVDL18-041461]MDO1563333.1 bifunctional 2-polyprenyl-6-hydroxyphenol methylase/3-demethylubi
MMNSQHQHNVDHSEIDKFSQLAHKWWDKTSEFKPLHDINPLRLNYIDRHAQIAGKTVLDVGCGGGILTESMAKHGAKHVSGIDMAEKSLKIAKLHALDEGVVNVDYRCVRVEDLAAEKPHSFDVVTCMEMMEHVPDPAAIVAACAKLVKPDGMVFFSTINRNPKSYVHAIVGAEYILGLVPRGTHDWQKFITPAELARMCRQAGLDIIDSKGLTYNLLTKIYSVGDNTDVNYMVACKPA